MRDLLESEQHVPRRDRRDVDLAVAVRLRDLQGEQQRVQDQVRLQGTKIYTLGRPLSSNVLFCFLSEVLVTNWAAVSAQRPVEHVKNALQKIKTEGVYSYLKVEPDPANAAAGPADLVDARRRRGRRHGGLDEVRVVLTRGGPAPHLN